MHVEDPFVLVFQSDSVSVDEPLPVLTHLIRDSYRQLLLQRSMKRRIDCSGPISQVNIALTRKFFFFTSQPLHKQMVRYFLTGALDHAQRLYKSNLLSTPMCIHCGQVDETAKHLFWDCRAWQPTHNKYPVLMIFLSLCGTFWPNNLLHCGWILDQFPYGCHLLPSLDIQYDSDSSTRDVHSLYLDILIQRYQASQVLWQVPVTPIQQHFSSCVSISFSRSALVSSIILDTP